MSTTALPYARPSTPRPAPLPPARWPAVVVALVGCPAASLAAAFAAYWHVLGDFPPNRGDADHIATLTATWGVLGGVMVALVAHAASRYAMAAAVVGSLAVSALTGCYWFVGASISVAC